MKGYNNFIGIDIGKDTFVVTDHHHKKTHTYAYESGGMKQFMRDFKISLPNPEYS